MPADATTKKYDDAYGDNSPWAGVNSELGNMVKLVDTIRNTGASTSQGKKYYKYMRPFRWSPSVKVLPTLVPCESTDPGNDGGFPSGHTNAGYLASLGLAYAAPERFQEMLTRASELGNDRIRAGMHSPLDVMGGRVNATAVAAAALNNKENVALKAAAYNEAHTKLFTQEGKAKDRFSNYKQNKEDYIKRLTYDFEQTGDKTKPMIVPKGAEALLETRLPYLDANQRRAVLYTTGLPSGYPVLDDAEGWGRLNLFSAADGYGALNDTVIVNMDAAKGGFNAADTWRNNISGTGALVKEGSGTLKLEGDNSFNGGIQIHGGILEADSATAFGSGSVINNGGTLVEKVDGKVDLKNDYNQSVNSTLELSIGSKNDVFEIDGNATFSGKLKLDFSNSYVPDNGMSIITFKSNSKNSQFTSIETTGLSSKYNVSLVYDSNGVKLSIKETTTSSSSDYKTSSSITTTEVKLGWQQKNGIWYNLSKEGTVNTGWYKDQDGKWYYLDQLGAMQTGWVKDTEGQWYYLNQSGAMEYDKYIDGYYVGANGAWVK